MKRIDPILLKQLKGDGKLHELFFNIKKEIPQKHKYPNLRVLVFSNPLVVDKISKKFLYYKDSGFIFTKNLLKSLPSNWRFDWIIPDKIKDVDWFLSANKNITTIPYPYSTSIHQNRYEFYGNILKREYPYTKDIDIVINNQPEVSANIWTWLYNQRRDLPIIFSYYHWIDCERSRKFSSALGGYFWRQYDGFLKSTFNLFHSEYAFELFRNEVKNNLKEEVDSSKVIYFNPPPSIFGNEEITLPEKKIILFNHRLNNSTNWRMFFNVAESLYKKRKDFCIWITDTKISDYDLIDKPYIKFKTVKDESYGYLISKSMFSVCTHLDYSTWNMAVLDSILNGCPVILPSTDGDFYKSFFGEGNFYHNFSDLEKIIDSILDNPEMLQEILMKQQRIISKIKPLDNIIENVLKEISITKDIKKYEDVYNYIKQKGQCYKKDFVNHFWSFHVNSNFLPIRWKLLMEEDIVDNNLNSETLYEVIE